MASVTDKITDTRNAARPVSTTVAAPRSAGGTTLTCASLTGWPTASKIHGVTYQIDSNSNPVAGTQIDFYGIVSGSAITQFTIVDGSDIGNSIGDVVEMLPTAAWGQDLADALTTQHNRDGTHKNITTDTLAVSGVSTLNGGTTLPAGDIGTNDLATNAVTAPKLSTSAITLDSVASSTSQGSISTSFVILTGLTSTVTIPAGGRRVRVEAFVPLFTSTAISTVSLAIYNAATVTGSPVQTSVNLIAVGGVTGTSGSIVYEHTPAAGSQSYCAAIKVDTGTGSTSLSATQLAYLTVRVL